MIGIAFSGGGVRGSYQIGAYYAFLKCHIKVDGLVGTSIGSLNAAAIAAGKHRKLMNFWYNVDAGKVMGFTENLGIKINQKKFDIALLKEVAINVKKAIINKGLSTANLRKAVESFELDKYLYKSNKDFGLVTVKFKDFKPVYMFKKDIKPELLVDYLVASCYLPIFKLEKIIDDNYYLDGGFHDYIPANALLDKGYNKVYVIDLQAVGVRRPYFDKKKVQVIKPSRNLGSIINMNQSIIRDNIKLGYYDTLKVLKNLDGYKYLFKVKGNWYYELLLKNVSKGLKDEMIKLFRTSNSRKLVIKAVEYVMLREKYCYYEVYNINRVIKDIKLNKKNYGVYRFVKKLNIFF